MLNNDIVKILAVSRFKVRSDSLENWGKENPILLSGEPGVAVDGTETEKIKFGDGVTPWNELGWWKGPKGDKGDKGEPGKDADGDLSNYYTKGEIDNLVGDIETLLGGI